MLVSLIKLLMQLLRIKVLWLVNIPLETTCELNTCTYILHICTYVNTLTGAFLGLKENISSSSDVGLPNNPKINT